MEEGHDILVGGTLQSNLSNPPAVQLLALCLASSIKSHVPDQIYEFTAPPVEHPVPILEKTIPLKGTKSKGLAQIGASSVLINNANDDAPEEEGSTAIIPGLLDETAMKCIAHAHRYTYGALSLTHRSLQQLIRSGCIYNLRLRFGIVEHWIYIFIFGDLMWRAFVPECGRWVTLPHCETDFLFDHSDKESLSAGTHLLWMGYGFGSQIGSQIGSYTVFRYELTTNTWLRGPFMNHARCLFASASCGEYAIVAGGNYDGTVLRSAEMYSSLFRRWERLPDMNNPRVKASGCFMDGKFYVIGGADDKYNSLTSAEVYDPTARKWSTVEGMFPLLPFESSDSSPPLVAVVKNELYYLDSYENVVKLYNKENNSWTTLGPVPVRADFQRGWGLAFKAVGEELYVIGGYRPDSAIYSWKPCTNGGPPDWCIVRGMAHRAGDFLCNCAVMSC